MRNGSTLTAKEAAVELGVNLQTLYTYVSRGLIRSHPSQSTTRDRYYDLEDILRLQHRKHALGLRASEESISWGAEIDSELTLVAGGHYYYRGRDALDLASRSTIEQVAGLLWTGATDSGESLFAEPLGSLHERVTALRGLVKGLPDVEAFQTILSLAAAGDSGAYDLRPASAAKRGARILKLMVMAITGKEPTSESSISETLQKLWAPNDPRVSRALDYALIVCADLAISPSTFAVRCVASARCTPYATVIAGLSTLLGLRRGRSYERVESLFDEVGKPSRAHAVLEARLRRGEEIAGIGNLLLEGDPRGKAILDLAQAEYPDSPYVALALAIQDAARDLIDEEPNLDLALVTLRRAMGLPQGSAPTLIALGRTVGWIAHTIEEYSMDRIIMPHTYYRGPRPRTVS